jgi:hypothetical protein
MGKTYLVDFGPLQEVPSDFLKKVQESTLLSRASGASNTMAVGLDSASTNHYGRKVIYSRSQPALGGFQTLDDEIDWRDRYIRVIVHLDIFRDIRPGEADDKALGRWRSVGNYYTSSGGVQFRPNSRLVIEVTAGGALRVDKDLGFLHLIIEGSVQVKERS